MSKRFVVGLILLTASVVGAAEYVPNVHSTEYESHHIITTNPYLGLYWISITWRTAANRWLIIYDSKTNPGDGILDGTKVLYCGIVSLASDGPIGTKSFDWTQHPLEHGSGKTVPSTAAGMVAIISVDSDGCNVKGEDGSNNWITAGFN